MLLIRVCEVDCTVELDRARLLLVKRRLGLVEGLHVRSEVGVTGGAPRFVPDDVLGATRLWLRADVWCYVV